MLEWNAEGPPGPPGEQGVPGSLDLAGQVCPPTQFVSGFDENGDIICSAPDNGSLPPPPGLISWWQGDGNPNDIQDSNDGILRNGTAFLAGKVGQAFSLDGLDDFVEVPSSASLQIAGSLTIEGFIRADTFDAPPGVDNQRAILTMFNPDSGRKSYGLVVILSGNGTTTHFVCGGTQLQTGSWYHVAGTFDAPSGLASVYVNGAMDGSAALPISSIHVSTERLLIGAIDNSISFSPPDSGHFGGLIDEISLYDRALSGTELLDIFNAGALGKTKPWIFSKPQAPKRPQVS